MLLLLVTVAVLQIVVPVALLRWAWRRRPPTRTAWWLDAAVLAAILAAVSVVLPWTVVPRVVRDAYAIAALASILRSWRRVRIAGAPPPASGWRALSLAARGLVAAVMTAISALAVAGMRAPSAPTIDLACPFPAGTFLAVNGGRSALLNGHLETLAPEPRYAAWRGQSYGIDLVEVNGWGFRAPGVLPADARRYTIYGQPVIAPCAGRVVSTADDRPDMPVPIPDPDRSKLAGNHVLIDCGGTEVLLAHFRPGSVQVSPGATVSVGAPLGEVGNSGNTTEPHLHISAQRRRPGDALIGGEPVWITIGGDFLVRNERLACG